MLDYFKVVQLLKKEFPSIAQEEIDYMISTLPTNMPFPAVKALVKMTKHLQNNPAKMKLLRLQTKQNVQIQTVSQDASCPHSGTQDSQ